MSNLKQYANAHRVYANDWDGYTVPLYEGTGPTGGWRVWFANPDLRAALDLDPYAAHRAHGDADTANQIPEGLYCPNIPEGWINANWCYGKAYALNWEHMDFPGWVVDIRQSNHLPSMREKHATVQMGESCEWRVDQAGANASRYWDVQGEQSGQSQAVSYRHDGTANFQFFDGHVETLTKEEGYPSSTTERRKLWWIYKD
jgi:prepilin-type processing-associated H-X9-DG protein